MTLKDTDIENLENYKNNDLPSTEKQALEKRLVEDASFRQQAHEYWTLMAALSMASTSDKRRFFKNINAEMPPVPALPMAWVRHVLLALAVLLAVFLAWYFIIREEKPKVQPIIAAYFEPYPALGIQMGDEDKTMRLEALVAYAKKDYKKAIPLLDKVFFNEKDSFLLFYEAISFIGNRESAKAIPLFELMQASTTLPTESILWYLALSYVDNNQKEKAMPLLAKLKNTSNGKYAAKAQTLIEKLK